MWNFEELKQEVMMNWDSGDKWGSCLGAFFPIAIEMDIRGLDIPGEWGYSPGMGGPCHDDGDYNGELVQESSDNALIKMGNILHRLSNLLETQGHSY